MRCDRQHWICDNIWGLVEIHPSLAMFSLVGFWAPLSLSFLICKLGEMRWFKTPTLEDMGQQKLPFTVGWVQIDSSSLENYLQVPPKVESKPTVWTSNSTLRYITNSNECLCSPEDMRNIHSNCNRKSPKLEVNQMPTRRIDFFKWSIYLYNGMEYSNENKQSLHTAIWVNPIGTMLSGEWKNLDENKKITC